MGFGADTYAGKEVITMEQSSGKWRYETPLLVALGQMDELTGSGGSDNADGWGHDNCA